MRALFDRGAASVWPHMTKPKPVILFLSANPKGSSKLSLDGECAAVMRELKMTPERGAFDFQTRWAVTIDDLMRELLELSPTIVHFAGHGGAEGISLIGPDGTGQFLSAPALRDLIDSSGSAVRAVVLNACFSEEQAQVLSELTGCAVGMRGTIPDAAAREFSVAFYRALGFGKSLYTAFRQAKAVLRAKQLDDRARPELVTRGDVSADALRFSAASTAAAKEGDGEATKDASAGAIHNTAGGDIVQVTLKELTMGDGGVLSFGSSRNK